MYKHWRKKHAGNPAAEALEARWRMALKNKTASQEALDAAHPWVNGDAANGFEELRLAEPTGDNIDDFKYCFDLHADAHREWLSASGCV